MGVLESTMSSTGWEVLVDEAGQSVTYCSGPRYRATLTAVLTDQDEVEEKTDQGRILMRAREMTFQRSATTGWAGIASAKVGDVVEIGAEKWNVSVVLREDDTFITVKIKLAAVAERSRAGYRGGWGS